MGAGTRTAKLWALAGAAILGGILAPAGASAAPPQTGLVFKYFGSGSRHSAPVEAAAPSIDAINVSISWRSVQRDCHAVREGKWDWDRADRAMRIARQHRLEVVATLGGGPSCTARHRQLGLEPRRAWLPAWSRYVRQLVARYGPGGRIPALRQIEPWNEPNLKGFAGTTADYRRLFLRTAAAVRNANPKVKTLAAAAALCCERSFRWLGRLYSKRAMRRHGHRVSLHTYAPTPQAALERLYRARKLLPARATIAITEHGWATCPEPKATPLGKCVTRDEQAAYLWQYFYFVRTHADALRVRSIFWFNGQDLATPESMAGCPSVPKYFYGLWTQDGYAKQALAAWEYMTGTDLPNRIPQHPLIRFCP